MKGRWIVPLAAAGMVLTGAAALARQGAAGAPRSFTYHWCVSGKEAAGVSLQGLPIRNDAVMLYQHECGLYPRFHEGQVLHGGVPQNADIPGHLAQLARDIDRLIPDRNFSGFAIIDYEGWDPVWEACREEYRALSRDLVRRRNPHRPERDIERLAKAGFESASRTFLTETLRAARTARPRAKWGFYGMPWGHHDVPDRRLDWLWQLSDALYPNAYMVHQSPEPGAAPGPGQAPAEAYRNGVTAHMGLARRLAGENKPVMALIWVRYHDMNKVHGEKFMERRDLAMLLRQPRLAGADGAIFWDNIATKEMAERYREYLQTAVRPELERIARE